MRPEKKKESTHETDHEMLAEERHNKRFAHEQARNCYETLRNEQRKSIALEEKMAEIDKILDKRRRETSRYRRVIRGLQKRVVMLEAALKKAVSGKSNSPDARSRYLNEQSGL